MYVRQKDSSERLGGGTVSLALAVVVGLGIGIFLQKGRFCFVNAFRDLFAFKDTRVTKAVVVAVVVTMVVWSFAYHFGAYGGLWLPPWGAVGLIGGFVFGVGMTYAGGCAVGTLFRAGEGYVQFWVTLVFMGVGYAVFAVAYPFLEATYFEPLTFGEGVTLFDNGVVPAPVVALGVAVGVVVVYASLVGRGAETTVTAHDTAEVRLAPTRTLAGLRAMYDGTVEYFAGFRRALDDPVASLRSPWDPRTAALGITAVAAVWFTQVSIVGITGPEARWTGYLVGLTGYDVTQHVYWGEVLFAGEGARVTPGMVMVAFIVVGAFVAAYLSGDFRLRRMRLRRLPNAVVGGFLMGAGSRLAPGCNIGNIYSGIAELSVHSFIAAVGILAGVYVTTHILYRDVGCAI